MNIIEATKKAGSSDSLGIRRATWNNEEFYLSLGNDSREAAVFSGETYIDNKFELKEMDLLADDWETKAVDKRPAYSDEELKAMVENDIRNERSFIGFITRHPTLTAVLASIISTLAISGMGLVVSIVFQ